MIKNKKTYALIIALSVACTGTYSSYSYFTSQSIETNNKIAIGELESEEGLQELIEANIKGDTLELKFSKRLYYPTENISEGVSGDKYIIDNTEVAMEGESLYIKKNEGEWILPTKKNEKNLPKISLENFEDRFGNKINAQDIYLYQNEEFAVNGKVNYVVADKDSKTDAEIIPSSIAGVSAIPGIGANTELIFNNSEEESVAMIMKVESKAEYEELVNDKKIKIIPTYGSEEYSEWLGDTLEVYLCYGKEYTEEQLQSAIDNVVNVDMLKARKHEFEISNIKVEFIDNTKVLKPMPETEEVEAVFINANNTIAGKNTRGSISVKSIANTTGRIRVKITDNEGLNIEEIFLSIKEETQQELMSKITSEILNKFDTKKYMLTSKEGNTRFDITSKESINTGLNIEIEIL